MTHPCLVKLRRAKQGQALPGYCISLALVIKFEDSIQYCCARDNKRVDVLITINTKDYKNSEIPVMTPADFLKTVSS